ncbi:ParB N-terminal domain-containing protein [Fusibacter ferrireducens]|uniref:ParB N-terminal domain-containing protein n=1 Tax=Fusibacter ferrireducens TaxID=2785058 RepID=A0ABR9ZXA2_9FIRM|nr:ParB N-terminal domain-containing protein [Fusibacter ferrireducens]MBF4695093.1 ParB N-terminal domain-containing protein [Fusibacter ferrireducens]
MDKNKTKKTETFASIFGDDYDETPLSKDEGVSTLKVEQLVSFPNHPFKLYEGARLDEMVESIKNFGVIVPIVVRKKGLKYEILSGHNRVNATKIAGLTEVPSIIKEGLTEEEATLIVTETNLMQRSFTDLVHSERAAVIATRHSAMKSQGVRTDLLNEIEKLSKAPNLPTLETSSPLDTKLDSKKEIGEEYSLSRASVARYLRVDKLSDVLKDMVDEGKIAMRAGVDLSYLSEDNQEMLEAIISENTFKVDMKKAALLRSYENEGKLNWNTAMKIISGDVLKSTGKIKPFKIQSTIISKFFGSTEKKDDIEKTIEKALELYFKHMKVMEPELDEEEEMIE